MKIAFCGDFYCGRDIPISLPDTFDAGRGIDHVVINFEGAIQDGFKSGRYDRVVLGQSCAALSTWRQVGSFSAGLANNHILDIGSEAVRRTVSEIEKIGGCAFGAASNPIHALEPLIISDAGGEVAVFALTIAEIGSVVSAAPAGDEFVCGDVRSDDLPEMVRAQKSSGRITVAYVHWDLTNHIFPSPRTRRIARDLVGLGFDAVIGHHPHVIQGGELIEGKPVFYSLGNFAFDAYEVEGRSLRLPRSNMRSLGVILDGTSRSFQVEGYFYDANRRMVSRSRSATLKYRILGFPLRANRAYGFFYRGYLIWRLFGRAVYWLSPSRVRQANMAQVRAVKLALGSIWRRK